MGNYEDSVAGVPAVIAVAQEENKLRGVKLRKRGGSFEVVWVRSSEAGRTDWRTFAAECGLSAEKAAAGRKRLNPLRDALTPNVETGGDRMVVGFDSAGVAVYRINLPAAGDEEVAAMVKLQTEARLPLPADEIELAWRTGPVEDGRVPVTIAAARRQQLRGFVEKVRGFQPATIRLDSEAIVKAWRTFFAGHDKPAVVVSIGSRNTRVCLAEGGRLISAVSLDMGTEDFSAGQEAGAQAESAERFAQDMRSVLELFGCPDIAKVPVFVLSDGGGTTSNGERGAWLGEVTEAVVSCLESAGLDAKAAVPDIEKLSAGGQLSLPEVYEYRVPIGLALIVADGDTEELNIFGRLYRPAKGQRVRHPLYSAKVAGAIAAAMFAVLVVICFAADAGSEKRWVGSETEKTCDQLVRRQGLIKTVARQRQKTDLLELLNRINSVEGNGIMLDSLEFKQGKPVTVSGQAPGAEQLYKFQESLLSKKGIRNVRIQSAPQDTKSKKLRFTMSFDYKSSPKGEAESL